MLDLLLRHYRVLLTAYTCIVGARRPTKVGTPLRKYVEETQRVNLDEEPCFFDEFDGKALQQQMDLQMRIAAYANKAKHQSIPQVLWIFDDLVDDERIMHSNHNQIAMLAIRSRHCGGNLWVSTQKYRALANIIRVNLTGLYCWPALSNRLERKAILEEISGRYTPEQIEEMLHYVSQRPFGFLSVDLKTTDVDRMYQDSLVQYLRPTE